MSFEMSHIWSRILLLGNLFYCIGMSFVMIGVGVLCCCCNRGDIRDRHDETDENEWSNYEDYPSPSEISYGSAVYRSSNIRSLQADSTMQPADSSNLYSLPPAPPPERYDIVREYRTTQGKRKKHAFQPNQISSKFVKTIEELDNIV
jgi:hypothetical protein